MPFQTSERSIFDTFLAATSETPSDSAPIPPTQETIEQQKEGEEEVGEEEGEKQDTAETDEPELIKLEEDTFSGDIIEKPEHDSPPRLPDDFYYDAEKVHAKPFTTDQKIFPENTLSL